MKKILKVNYTTKTDETSKLVWYFIEGVKMNWVDSMKFAKENELRLLTPEEIQDSIKTLFIPKNESFWTSQGNNRFALFYNHSYNGIVNHFQDYLLSIVCCEEMKQGIEL